MTNDLLCLTPEEALLLVKGRGTYNEGQDARELWARLNEYSQLALPDLGKDTVWGGLTTRFVRAGTAHNQTRTIVRAKSKAEAVRMLVAAGECISIGIFNNYWAITKNLEELALVKEPGIWAKSTTGWKRVQII